MAPDGTVSQLTGLPSNGTIFSVAINQNAVGLVGGQYALDPTSGYAALVAPDGTVSQLTGLPSNGTILSVAINQSGVGLIGGSGQSGSYAALVAPDGTISPLTGLQSGNESNINSVAINQSGVGLIGGGFNSTSITGGGPAYAALVAPNGTTIQLIGGGLPSNGQILSVALLDGVLDILTPTSIGSYLAPVNMQLAATYALEAHLIRQNRLSTQKKPLHQDISLTADAGDVPKHGMGSSKENTYTLWAAPFGNYVREKSEENNPSTTNEIAGILAAFDYASSNVLLGMGLGYAFNYIHYGDNIGHGKVNEELVYLYGTFQEGPIWINASLWGGYYQFHNKRHTLSFITSTSDTHGWILAPHLEIASTFKMQENYQMAVQPFIMFDWVNNWQNHFTEKGSSGLNLVMDDVYASVLRSEAGVRLYETFPCSRGNFLLEEKISYANQTPFHAGDVNTFFVGGSASSFPIAIGSNRTQNLGVIELQGSFVPNNKAYPYFIPFIKNNFQCIVL